jgi:hypothetical protein
MNIVGLKVEVDPTDCGQPVCRNICTIDPGRGPHVGELRCCGCGRHRGWLQKDITIWLQSIVAIFGRPTTPIAVREACSVTSEATAVSAREYARRILEINLRLARAGLEQKDMLLSARPSRDWWTNQQRKKIAQLMHSYKITAHDLPKISELPTDIGAVGGMKANAPESESKMDMSRFAPVNYLRVSDLKSGSIKVKIANVEIGNFDKPDVTFDSGDVLSLNTTNTGILCRAYGSESTDWIGMQVELFIDTFEYNGEQREGIKVKPLSPPLEDKKPITVQPKKKGVGSDLGNPDPWK